MEEAVGVSNEVFRARGVGVSAVNEGAEDLLEGELVEELTAVISGALGEPEAEEAVGVSNEVFRARGVGVSAVNEGAEDLLEGELVEELTAVIGG